MLFTYRTVRYLRMYPHILICKLWKNINTYGTTDSTADNCEILVTILIVADNQQGSAHWKLLKFQQYKKHCMVKIFADMEHESTV